MRLNNVILYHKRVILGHVAMNAAILTTFDKIIILSIALFIGDSCSTAESFTYSLLQHSIFNYNKMSWIIYRSENPRVNTKCMKKLLCQRIYFFNLPTLPNLLRQRLYKYCEYPFPLLITPKDIFSRLCIWEYIICPRGTLKCICEPSDYASLYWPR